MSFKVTKTTVNAPSRQLKATWNPKIPPVPKISETAVRYTIEQALKRTLLQNHGTRVEVYVNEWEETSRWCEQNCKSHWDMSRDPQISSAGILKREADMALGKATQEDMEVLFVNALARQCNQDAAEAEGRKHVYIYFWFEDANEAMRFKLTWGGA